MRRTVGCLSVDWISITGECVVLIQTVFLFLQGALALLLLKNPIFPKAHRLAGYHYSGRNALHLHLSLSHSLLSFYSSLSPSFSLSISLPPSGFSYYFSRLSFSGLSLWSLSLVSLSLSVSVSLSLCPCLATDPFSVLHSASCSGS